MKTALFLFSACIIGGFVTPAFAQMNTSDTNARIFKAEYFNKFTPRTALDMVRQIPGFQIQEGSSKRGLGQGGANILINGERISSKTSANDFLSRINAKDVKRIELLDGAKLDIPGLSGQVVNVIASSGEISGTWNWSPYFRKNLQSGILNGSIGLSGKKNNLDWQINFRNFALRFGNWGPEERRLTDGTLFEIRDEKLTFIRDDPRLSVNIGYKPKQDHLFNLSAEYSQPNTFFSEISKHQAISARGDNDEQHFFRGQDSKKFKISADYEFPFGPESWNGKLKLISLYDDRHTPSKSVFDTYRAGELIAKTNFFAGRDTLEAIGRAEYSWKDAQNRDWQWALEGAFNVLDGSSKLEVLDINTGQFNEIPLAGGTAKVEEKRAETNITHSRKLTDKWSLQTSLGVEYSEISQTGANGLTREFVRPKGYLSSSYQLDASTNLRVRIEREVGQLNFSDFLSSVSLRDNLNTTGNIDLVPEQIWAGQLEWDRQFKDGHTLRIKLYADLIDDLVDRIPIGTDGDAVGNIDSAQRYGIDINASLKGDQWGYKGTRLDLVLDLADSKLDDPLTGQSRQLNRNKEWFWSVKFRHDIDNTNWAYGGEIEHYSKSNIYRLNTISSPSGPELSDIPTTEIFIENKNMWGLKVNLSLTNILGAKDIFHRQIFTNRRDIGVLDIEENYQRDYGQTLKLSISGEF